jgi:ribosomal protein S12 methylthiotransferase
MQLQQGISRARLAERVGRQTTVLVDSVEGTKVTARSQWDAPEIDGVVTVKGARGAKPGDVLAVELTAAKDYDLTARVLKTP